MNKKVEQLNNSILKFKYLLLVWFVAIPFISDLLIISTIYFGYWYLVLAYFIYIYISFKQNPNGSRLPNQHRDSFIFNIARDYFDMKLIKTSEISSKKNNIFCYHPHGVVPFGMYCALNSNACGFDDLFPGIKLNLKGHLYNLIHPLLREFTLYFGSQSISRESVLETLKVPGNSVGISVGGGAEMMFAVPNTSKLIIKNRFGFVKIALETGSDLVPVYAFGENEVYNQDPVDEKSFNFRVRRWLYKKTNFFMPSITGRGIFPNSKGIFPNSVPIRIVVGKPINVEKVDSPTDEQIKELHGKYCKELEALYNEYKDEFWYDSSTYPPKIQFVANPLK